MITTKRLTYDNNGQRSDIDLLERNTPKTYDEYICDDSDVQEESLEEARERMHKNLDRLLNHDRYEEEEKAQTQEVVAEFTAPTKEDTTPTSTTMQFGTDDVGQMYKEMNFENSESVEKYKLNAKGKLVVALYAIAVTIIMALIVINTGIISTLNKENQERAFMLTAKIDEYEAINNQIENISSNEYISNIAETEYKMVKR